LNNVSQGAAVTSDMHDPKSDDRLREAIFKYASERLDFNPPPLDGPKSPEVLTQEVGNTITEMGLGGEVALKLFSEKLAPATISVDHPGFLSFIPAAPTDAASLFDLIVSASSIYGGSWLEGAGAVYAENQVLSFLAAEVGFPNEAGGVFVQGGTLGNLSALTVAREQARATFGEKDFTIICSEEAHSSVSMVASVIGVSVTKALSGKSGSIGYEVAETAAAAAKDQELTPMAIVGTAGTTNFGIVDDLTGLARLARELDVWFHVDGAYGIAGVLVPELKPVFAGIEDADSFIVDPHKWLFAPFDACALVYRRPELAKRVFSQHGEYLEPINKSTQWNPSDYAFNLSRRARGLPLWFSLAAHGIEKYRSAVRANVELARDIAEVIQSRPELRLVRRPQLSIVVFEVIGWGLEDYEEWSEALLSQGLAFVLPSSLRGAPHTRFAIVNPQTNLELLTEILDTIRK
jgi:glutamate/tyrosine decarboxylase-like PLP-dependent enzyme